MNLPYEYRNIPWKEKSGGQSGRVLVSMERVRESRLDVYNYEGSPLPAYLVYAVLKVALAEGWVESLEELHQNRKNKWKVEMSGSAEGERQYRLCTLRGNKPVCSSVIAISNSQIQTFSILAEDAAPLLKKIIEDYPPVLIPRYRNNRNTSPPPPAFYYLYTQNLKFFELPEPIKKQREEAKGIRIPKNIFSSETFKAGETSGIMEMIEALKCLEVLQA